MDYELSSRKSLQTIADQHIAERSNQEYSVRLTGDVVVLDGEIFHIGIEQDELNRPGSQLPEMGLYQFAADVDGNLFVSYSGSSENVLELAEENYFSNTEEWQAKFRKDHNLPPLA